MPQLQPLQVRNSCRSRLKAGSVHRACKSHSTHDQQPTTADSPAIIIKERVTKSQILLQAVSDLAEVDHQAASDLLQLGMQSPDTSSKSAIRIMALLASAVQARYTLASRGQVQAVASNGGVWAATQARRLQTPSSQLGNLCECILTHKRYHACSAFDWCVSKNIPAAITQSVRSNLCGQVILGRQVKHMGSCCRAARVVHEDAEFVVIKQASWPAKPGARK